MTDAQQAALIEEEKVEVDHLLELSQIRFELTLPDELSPNKAELRAKIMEIITKNNMAPYYDSICDALGWTKDNELLSRMRAENEAELKALDEKYRDSVENFGDMEVRESLLAKAQYLAKIGDKEQALKQYQITSEKTVGVGMRLDLVFALLRIGFAFHDQDLVKRNIEKAKIMIEEGGDWERRNRLKVYEGTYNMSIRNFKKAANLFLDSIATFSSYEVMNYRTFIKYTVLMGIIALDRPVLKQKIIDASEILTVIHEIPRLSEFLTSMYSCNYKTFFSALVDISDMLHRDRYLAPHSHFYLREVRIKIYAQFLESYRSVTMDSMARTFGVSVQYLDNELSRFIATGRLNCKIDKVGGIVETNRPDAKNAQYQAVIKQGDILLNRIQKLSRVCDI